MNRLLGNSLLATALVTSQSYFFDAALANSTVTQQSAIAGEKSAAKSTPCKFSAFVDDSTPVNVRSGPGTNFKSVAKLPTKPEVIVTITACQGSWLKVGKAENLTENKVLFQGKEGWVSASTLGIGISVGTKGKAPIYASPNVKSRVLTNVTKVAEGAKLLGGQGQWIRINYNGTTGWILPENQCARSVTTCS
ncbi:MAG: SH3 domain-containing protein [Scytonematopsis contorta HA4267-MV1]|jgi:SH3-like domain-containing protein|nr:SH3 domain-containing protein [Scytonematopsis contorta HA4267-MV1]